MKDKDTIVLELTLDEAQDLFELVDGEMKDLWDCGRSDVQSYEMCKKLVQRLGFLLQYW